MNDLAFRAVWKLIHDFTRVVILFIKNAIEFFKKHPTHARILLFALLYFFIRTGWQGSIEFGYDPARLSQMVSDILDKHELGETPQYILSNIGAGAIAWGPAFVYLMIPIFLVTRDPLVITNILIVFQFIGIVALYLGVELLYNKRVAFFATIFTVAFPWHVYFTRLIYNPSMLVWSVPLVIYVTLLVIKKGKQKLLFVLPFLWLFMIQFHFVGLVVLVLSLGYIIVHNRKVTWKYFRVGLVIAIIPLLPIIVFDMSHDFAYSKGVLAGNKHPTDPDNKPGEVVKVVIDDTQKYMLLTDVYNNLGYATEDFFKSLPFIYKLFHPLYVVLFSASLLFYLIKILWKPRGDDVFVLIWFLSVTIFLIAFNFKSSKVITISPRYFIPSFFAIGIMIGYMIDKTLERITRIVPPSWLKIVPPWIKIVVPPWIALAPRSWVKIVPPSRIKIEPEKFLNIATYVLSGVFCVGLMAFMIAYHTFIITYKYMDPGHYGWLGVDSGPPYLSTYSAFKYALGEAKKEGFNAIVPSDDWNENQFHLREHTGFIWKYVFKGSTDTTPGVPFYYICPGLPPERIPPDKVKQFGTWRVASEISLETKATFPGIVDAVVTKSFSLVSVNSGMCLTELSPRAPTGSVVVQFNFLGHPDQHLHFVPSDETGYLYIVCEQSGRYLDIGAGNFVSFKPASGQASQKWKLGFESQKVRLISKIDGKAVSVENGSRNIGARLIAEPVSASESQLWKTNYY